ncbi:MAG: hypothetical protein DMG71_01545, partial [Acidobacteria bacterium]
GALAQASLQYCLPGSTGQLQAGCAQVFVLDGLEACELILSSQALRWRRRGLSCPEITIRQVADKCQLGYSAD